MYKTRIVYGYSQYGYTVYVSHKKYIYNKIMRKEFSIMSYRKLHIYDDYIDYKSG